MRGSGPEKDRGASLSCFVLRCRSAYNSEGTLATPGIVSVMSVELDFSEICAYVTFACAVIEVGTTRQGIRRCGEGDTGR